MKKIIAVVGVCFCHAAVGQVPEGLETFHNDTEHLDSGQVLVGFSLVGKMVFEKPETILKTTSQGNTYLDEEARRVRLQGRGAMNFLVYPSRDLRDRIQPHFMLEVNGLTTYASVKYGGGITDRALRVSYGAFLGSYIKRVDEYTDFGFRTHNLESAGLYGAYAFWDYRDATFFLTYARERGKTYYARGEVKWKAGEVLKLPGLLSGVRLHVEHESFLGTGGGVSYRDPGGHLTFGATYLVPDRGEQKLQRIFGNFLGEGIGIKLAYLWY